MATAAGAVSGDGALAATGKPRLSASLVGGGVLRCVVTLPPPVSRIFVVPSVPRTVS